VGLFDILGSPRDRYAKLVLRRLREAGLAGLAYDRRAFAISLEGGGYIDLERTFPDWRTYPSSKRPAVLDEVVAFLLEAGSDEGVEDLEAIAPRLTPLVRPLGYLATVEPPSASPGRHLAGPLVIALAVDRPHSLAYLNQDQLDNLGEPFDRLLELAMANLRKMETAGLETQRGGFFTIDAGGVFASSRLLQIELFEDLPFRGSPVAVASARDMLLVADSADPGALEAMASFASEIMETTLRPVAYQPLILREREWQVFEPTADMPPAVRRLPVQQLIWEYAQQQAGLEAAFEARGEDLLVAQLDAVERGGEIFTQATWTDDVATLLPKADMLILNDAEFRALQRRWNDVETVCGAFLQEPDLDPPRYRTGRPIDAAQWRRLRTEFAPPNGWRELS
jgi:hypothetical protein